MLDDQDPGAPANERQIADEKSRDSVRTQAGNESRDEVIEGCRGALKGVFKTLGAGAQTAWFALDLTMTQMRCLAVLRVKGAQTVGGLAEALKVTEPTASQLVERLVRREMVVRTPDPTDRRRILVELTPEAERQLDSIRAESQETVQEALTRMGDEELKALRVGLGALAAACGAASAIIYGCGAGQEADVPSAPCPGAATSAAEPRNGVSAPDENAAGGAPGGRDDEGGSAQ